MSRPEDLIAVLDQSRPQAVRLAELVSPAIRIEPELLRAARVELLPDTDAGCEADLWFSDLVQERSPIGIVLHTEVAALLRARLAADRDRMTQAARVIDETHRAVPAAVRLEEELTVLAMRGDIRAVRDRLRSAVASLLDSDRAGLAAWAGRALGRLPAPALDLEEAQMLAAAARLRVGETAAPTVDVPPERLMEWIDWLAPSTPEIFTIGVGLVKGGVEIGAIHGHDVHEIQVSSAPPVMVEVTWPAQKMSRRKVVRVGPEDVVFVAGPTTSADLRLPGGDRYHVEAGAPPRSRSLRVLIDYDVEMGDAIKKVELPFVVGVMADFLGQPGEPPPDVRDRKFLEIDIDNFDDRLKAMRPRVALAVPNMLADDDSMIAVELTFERLDDFAPAAVARQVASLHRLLEMRTHLSDLLSRVDGRPGAEKLMNKVMEDPKYAITYEFAERLMKELRAPNERELESLEVALRSFAQSFLDDPPRDAHDAVGAIEVLIARYDQKLTDQLNPILHDPEFQRLEGTWRGLNHLVNHTETGADLKIRILNVSKTELPEAVHTTESETWDHSPIYNKVYEDEFGMPGGEPYGCLVGDYYFDHTLEDVKVLGAIARIAATAHAPFLAGAAPSILRLQSWQELSELRSPSDSMESADYVPWRSLRQNEDTRYIALAMPRFLSRVPYGPKTNPIEAFDFTEATDGTDHDAYCWANSAFAMAANITRAFKQYGWCARIRGVQAGGAVEGLPIHTFPTDDGGIDEECPTEIAIGDRREAELTRSGLMPLMHRRGTDIACFVSAATLYAPRYYRSNEAAEAADAADAVEAVEADTLTGRLPYLFAMCRFAHYIKCLMRDRVGSFMEREDLDRHLNEWLVTYVSGLPLLSDEGKAHHPLAAGRVEVGADEDDPRQVRVRLLLRPQYQLEPPSQPLALDITLLSPFNA